MATSGLDGSALSSLAAGKVQRGHQESVKSL